MPNHLRREVSDVDTNEPVSAFLARATRRLRLTSALYGIAAGAAATAASLVAALAANWPLLVAWTIAIGIGVLLAMGSLAVTWRRWTSGRVAALVERRVGSLDNLLIVAVELPTRSRPVHPHLAIEIVRQATIRLQALEPTGIVPVRGPAVLAATVCVAAFVVGWTARSMRVPPAAMTGETVAEESATGVIGSVTVRVTPPPYTRLPERTVSNPTEVRLIEGSRVDVEVAAAGIGALDLIHPDDGTVRMTAAGDRHRAGFMARGTRVLLLRPVETHAGADAAPSSASSAARLLSIIVEPDRSPIVRIRAPARDLAFPKPEGRISLQIEASDDVGLEGMEVRYTHITGSGETFSFKEGKLLVGIGRTDRAQWTANAELSLAALGLEQGDTLVYRALARDGRPGADPASSESYIVEVGEMAGVASSGFALPEDKERHAISQQMVIVKTERLHKERAGLAREDVAEQSRMLAVEQRMVRAEFVFMTGGEVQDEVEEAEHSHDLVEGRFENEGQVELLAAIREMSRAEAALNAADTAKALAFERAALAALQRAFDRRRYFLRTLPERARIDLDRRLSGERDQARPWEREAVRSTATEAIGRMRDLMRALEAGLRDPSRADLPSLAARFGSLAPGDADVQSVAVELAAAGSGDIDGKTEAMRAATGLLSARAVSLLAPPAGAPLPADAVIGHFADERGPRGRR